ncbi:hypothetical protein EZV62_003783 [Acer yangbiense]|uniref:Uncharacterized protein n=1 Tax=Acer yangbiense TaxID=1000413 RepID=A0A5C7II97_9ROSI|nr:hypothetical protein EZV62_003783 [Acer yangbiense]
MLFGTFVQTVTLIIITGELVKQVAWLVHILLSGEQFAASMPTLALASRDVLVHAPVEAIGATAEFYTWLKPHSCHLLPCTSYKHVDDEEKKNHIICKKWMDTI